MGNGKNHYSAHNRGIQIYYFEKRGSRWDCGWPYIKIITVCLKLHNGFAYFNQKINPWRMVFYFLFYCSVIIIRDLSFFCFLILLPHQNKDLITA